jgi:hypothetical protein
MKLVTWLDTLGLKLLKFMPWWSFRQTENEWQKLAYGF